MRARSRLVLACSFAGLLFLTAFAGITGLVIVGRIRAGEATLRARDLERSSRLERIRSNILLSGTLARDYYTAPNAPDAGVLLERVESLKAASNDAIDQYAHSARVGEAYVSRLRGSLVAYWKVLDFMIGMARRTRSPGVDAYFHAQLAGRREEMLRIAEDVGRVLVRERQARETQLAEMYAQFRTWHITGVILVLLAGSAIAIATARRLLRLESEARALSVQLVEAQEKERRSIARELHDEVGQGLTGLLLDVGAALRTAEPEVRSQLETISATGQRLIEEVRRIALSLRPSMLDDLGLVPALEWQAREVGQRSGLTVEVQAEESAGELPEAQRICVYRVVQEALQNCVRHAHASQVEVALERHPNGVSLRVKDDGKGFVPSRTRGLGLLGMEERVGQLGGRLRILSEPGRGTTLTAQLPV